MAHVVPSGRQAPPKPEDEEEEEEEEEEEVEEGEEEEDGDAQDPEVEAEEGEEEGEEEEDEEEEDEDEDEEDEEEDDAIAVKVTRAGDTNTRLIQLPGSIKYSAFTHAIAKRFPDLKASPAGFIILWSDPDGDRVEIDSARTFRRVVRHYAEGEEQYLRLVVTERVVARPGTANASPAFAGSSESGLTVPAPYAAQRRPSTPGVATHWAGDCAIDASGGMSNQETSELFEMFGSATADAPSGSGSGSGRIPIATKPVLWQKMGVLGKGSFGTVYEAITSNGKLMAVKVMELPADKLEGEDSNEVRSLMSEINLMRQLKHPNIVAYYGCQMRQLDSGAAQFEIFLEHCHGGSLTSLRKKVDRERGRLGIVLLRNYIRQVLEGLAFLHQQKIQHRDLKGDNILISSTGRAKLADFGCSKKLGTSAFEDGVTKQLSSTMVGTPLMMAPEVIDDSGPGYSRPADIWALGCVVIECLGRKPWTMTGTNLFQIMFQIAQAKTMPNGVPTRFCPPPLQDFFERCFDRDPARRATAQELLRHEWMTCPDEALEEPIYEDDFAAAAAAATPPQQQQYVGGSSTAGSGGAPVSSVDSFMNS